MMMPRPGVTVRLRLETLEAREVPATVIWTGAADSDAWNEDNWDVEVVGSNVHDLPQAGDNVVFAPLWVSVPPQFDLISTDCVGFHGLAGAYHSVTVQSDYDATVTLIGGFTTGDLTLAGGTIDQPSPTSPYANTDITVTDDMVWTGGTLNKSLFTSKLHLIGASGIIDPGDGNTITTGSFLYFEASGTTGTTANFNSGKINFNNDTGLTVNQYCLAQIQPAATKKVEFYGNATVTNGKVAINTGGTVKVVGDWDGFNMPLLNAGGTLEVMNKVTATFSPTSGPPGLVAFITQTSGTIKLHSESTLSASPSVNGYTSITGGSVVIVADSPNPATAPALLVGNLVISDATVTFTGNIWTFKVDGDVTWSNATFETRPDLSTTDLADNMVIAGALTIPAGKQLKVKPLPINAQNGTPTNFAPVLITAMNGIVNPSNISLLASTPTFTTVIGQPGGNVRTLKLLPG